MQTTQVVLIQTQNGKAYRLETLDVTIDFPGINRPMPIRKIYKGEDLLGVGVSSQKAGERMIISRGQKFTLCLYVVNIESSPFQFEKNGGQSLKVLKIGSSSIITSISNQNL